MYVLKKSRAVMAQQVKMSCLSTVRPIFETQVLQDGGVPSYCQTSNLKICKYK